MKNKLQAFRRLTAQNDDADSAVQCKRTQTLSIWEGCLWSLMWGLGESYLAPFALFLGAGNLVMAFIGTAPVFITSLAQLAGASLLDRVGRRKPIILYGMAAQASMYLPLFLLPILIPAIAPAAVMIGITLYFLLGGLLTPSWMSMIGDVVEESERGRYFSNRTRLAMYAMIFSMLAAGIIMNQWNAAGHTAVGFGFLFGIAVLARITSMFFMRRHYDAPLDPESSIETFSFWKFLRDPGNKNYAKFTFAIALMNGTANIAGPFFAVHMLRNLQWSYFAFTLNMLTFLISQTLFVRWWGGIGDRHGNRAVLMATGSLLPILPILWVFTPNYLFLLCAQVVSGAVWSGFNLAASNFIYDSVPQSRRARASSYYSVINGLFSLIGGVLVGAYIAEHAPADFNLGMIHVTLQSSLPLVFIVSGLARAVAAAIMLPQFSEVRTVEPISTGRLLWLLTTGQPLFGQVGNFLPRLLALRPRKNHKR